jgi:signal transduction histidine kinase
MRLSIVDHGIGISTELKDKIFEPLFSTKPDGIGTGMGLSIANAREIMRKHGGYLSIISRPDCGTAVHLYFPEVK